MPDLSVAERQQYLTMAVRDFLNEGGKLVHAGETAGYYGLLGGPLGGIYYGLDGAPDQDCVVTVRLLQRLPAAAPTTSPSTTSAPTAAPR